MYKDSNEYVTGYSERMDIHQILSVSVYSKA